VEFIESCTQVNKDELDLIGDLLTSLELAEVKLMEWGFFDVSHTDAEVVKLFEEHPTRGEEFCQLVSGTSPTMFVDDMATAGLLYRIKTGDPSLFRSRFAESIRLMVRLKQRFKPDDWDTAPELVSDARFHLNPRRFPVRDINFERAWNELSQYSWNEEHQKKVLESLMGGSTSILLASFQLRSAVRILKNYRGSERPTGTVVTAGTGGGKTKSFYIPALMGIVADLLLSSLPSTKVLSIYPRNVLLADQFGEATDLALSVYSLLNKSLPRPIRVGCLTGDVPFSSNFETDYRNREAISKWVRPRGIDGVRLPHLRDRSSGKNLVWLDADRLSGCTALRYEDNPSKIAIPDGVVVLTREELMSRPPDIFLTSIEMINKELSSELGVKVLGFGTGLSELRLVLLDEIHTYEGLTGAQVPWILRRLSFWTKTPKRNSYHVVGLSATLQDASNHLATLTGVSESAIEEITPRANLNELTIEGQEYNVVLKSHPGSGAGVFATSIQAVMLGARILTPIESTKTSNLESIDPSYYFGRKLFGFTDNLDVVNRWLPDFDDAERRKRLPRLRLPQPGDNVQWEAGQSWRLCQNLHHDLNNSLRVGRTSSQDPGVDSKATIILATSALEVGFDDDEVGMVLQHKAPLSAASFLQRKGRAGRRKGMRPWTVVVLSEFGRDRWTFKDSERLFSPNLDRLSVPVFNPYVLKIQATWFLVDWVAKKVGHGVPSLYLARSKYFDREATRIVEELLVSEEIRVQFTRDLVDWIKFARGGVRVVDPELLANDILWNPPRSIFRQVIPNLWNYLKGDPSIVHRPGVAPLLPKYLPQRTWQVLDAQDVEIEIQGVSKPENMDIRRALQEITPGRVSRRFSIEKNEASKWISWSRKLLDVELPSEAVVDELFKNFEINEDLDGISIFQPTVVELENTPQGVKKISNATWEWNLKLFTVGESGYLTIHTGPIARSIFESASVWMHRERSWVQAYRFSDTFKFELHRERRDTVRGHVAVKQSIYKDSSRKASVGYVKFVDGIELKVSEKILSTIPLLSIETIASLKPLYLRYLASKSDVLQRRTSVFETASLITSALGMLCATALRNQINLKDAWEKIVNKPLAAGKVLSSILVGDIAHDPDQISDGTSVRDIVSLWSDQEIAKEIDKLVEHLWKPLDSTWQKWIRIVFLETLRSSVESAVQSVLPETPDSDFKVEAVAVDTTASIWILEQESGGIGVIDRFISETNTNANLFDSALESSLLSCSSERLVSNLIQTVKRSRYFNSSTNLAFAEVRNASSYAEIDSAKSSLISALEFQKLEHDKDAVTAILGKVLMRGSNSKTDRWIGRLTKGRQQVSKRLGIEIDPKIWAYCIVSEPRRYKYLEQTLHEIYQVKPIDRQVISAVNRLTLTPCSDSCADCLGTPKELEGTGSSRRLIKEWLNLKEVETIIDINPSLDWMNLLKSELARVSRIKLRFSDSMRTDVSAELSALLANRIDRGYLLSSFRVSSVTAHSDGWEIMLRVDDMEAT